MKTLVTRPHRQRVMNFYFTYVLQSLKDDNLYIGWTNDLKNRYEKHKSRQVNSTKNRLAGSRGGQVG